MATNPYATTITGTAGYRMLSSPKTGFTVADISDDTAVQGVTGGDNTSFTSNFYTFGSTGAWTVPTNVNTAIADGYGFILKFFNNTEAGSSSLPITLDVTGTEPSNNVVVNFNKTVVTTGDESAYYTLLGNPFASNIALSELSANGDAALGTSVKIWDNAAELARPRTSVRAAVDVERLVQRPFRPRAKTAPTIDVTCSSRRMTSLSKSARLRTPPTAFVDPPERATRSWRSRHSLDEAVRSTTALR
jgi:hypothetical protein